MIRTLAVAALAMAPALAGAPAAFAVETPGVSSKNFTPPPNTPSYFTNERAVPYMSLGRGAGNAARPARDSAGPPASGGAPSAIGAGRPVAIRPAPTEKVDVAVQPPRPGRKPAPPRRLDVAARAPAKPDAAAPPAKRLDLAAEPPRPGRKPAPPPVVEAAAGQTSPLDLAAGPPRPARKPQPPPLPVRLAAFGAAPAGQRRGPAPVIPAPSPALVLAVLAGGPAGWTGREGRPYNRRMERLIPFLKMHGLGNDFVVLDGRARPIAFDAEGARALAERHTGIGCDQVILIEPARQRVAHALMRIRNADGGEVAACGNATRCVALLLARESGDPDVRIETAAGLLNAEVLPDGRIAVDMGPARTLWHEIPLARPMETDRVDLALGPLKAPVCTNIGNPHATFFVADAEAIDLAALGPTLEHDPLFPEGANIGVAAVLDPRHLRLRVWERGAGLTLACGTGACAAVVAAYRRGLAERRAEVALDGGSLAIAWREDGHVTMTGPAAVSYEGRFAPGLLTGGR